MTYSFSINLLKPEFGVFNLIYYFKKRFSFFFFFILFSCAFNPTKKKNKSTIEEMEVCTRSKCLKKRPTIFIQPVSQPTQPAGRPLLRIFGDHPKRCWTNGRTKCPGTSLYEPHLLLSLSLYRVTNEKKKKKKKIPLTFFHRSFIWYHRVLSGLDKFSDYSGPFCVLIHLDILFLSSFLIYILSAGLLA